MATAGAAPSGGIMGMFQRPEFWQWASGVGGALSRAGAGQGYDLSQANQQLYQSMADRQAQKRLGGLMDQFNLNPQQRAVMGELPPDMQRQILAQQAFPSAENMTDMERAWSMLNPEERRQAARIAAGLEQKAGGMDPTSAMQEAQYLYPNDPEAQRQYVIQKGTKPMVSVDMKGEGKYEEELGKIDAQNYGKVMDAGSAAQGRLATYNTMERLLMDPSVYSGAGGETVAAIKSVADAFGVDVGNMGPTQAFEAIGNELTLQMRNASEGGGMPGAMSDKDREFLKKMTPSLTKTREGNLLLIQIRKRMEERNIMAMEEAMKMRREGVRFNRADLEARMDRVAGELFTEEEWLQLLSGLPTEQLRAMVGK